MKKIVLVLEDDNVADRLLPAASVLTTWLGATLRVITTPARAGGHRAGETAGLGVPTDPLEIAEGSMVDAVIGNVGSFGPTLIVTDSPALARAAVEGSGEPAFIVSDAPSGHRFPPGPVVVPLDGGDSDEDLVATAAGIGLSLDMPLLAVTGADASGPGGGDDAVSRGIERLTATGCRVDVAVRTAHSTMLDLAGRRKALAVVLPVADGSVVEEALALGQSVVLAPSRTSVGRNGPADTDRFVKPWADDTAALGPAMSARIETLDYGACMDRLARHSLARIGYIENGRPMVTPVNYRFVDGAAYIRSMDGGKARAAERADQVCLEIDGFDERLRCGWSVVMHGSLHKVDDPSGLLEAFGHDPQPWVRADRWHWLRLNSDRIEGRTVEPEAG